MDHGFARKLRLKQLMVVVALSETGNMHRAAEALGMTQSTASKLLGDVEAMLGVTLFVREPRGMRPTELGHEVIDFARATLVRIDRFREDLEAKIAGGHGLLVVGAIMGAAPDLIARTVADLKAERPRLMIRLLGETSDQILDMLEGGTVDVAVGRFSTPRHWQLFDFERLSEEPMRLVVRAGHPLGASGQVTLKALHGWPWIMQPGTNPTRQMIDSAFSALGLGPPVNAVESGSIFAILQLLQTSDAVAFLPISVVRDHLNAGLLTALYDPIGKPIGGFGIVRRRGEPLSPNAEAFVDKLRAVVARTPG
ncbi:LysR family transcriptional regulator [Acidimangrovimonas sediminis]|uniref:LysR family transcriptional regulator n=1 Tax=Acidimangrovimonas sediminis TaxID=2056283 RepID=UPI000C7FD8F0|nr:LysR family transcriptional regulator [Acidimangrovimonas sediminis]